MESLTAGVSLLASKITSDVKPEEALKLTQAALNLAHAQSVMAHTALVVKTGSATP